MGPFHFRLKSISELPMHPVKNTKSVIVETTITHHLYGVIFEGELKVKVNNEGIHLEKQTLEILAIKISDVALRRTAIQELRKYVAQEMK